MVLIVVLHPNRMSKVCEKWTLEELCDLTEEDMERLLGFFKPGKVPKLADLRGEKDEESKSLDVVGFDGSFGWW